MKNSQAGEPMRRTCEYCNDPFDTADSNDRFCSESCYFAAAEVAAQKVERNAINLGAADTVPDPPNNQTDDQEDEGWLVYRTVEKDGELESEAWCDLHAGQAPAVVEISEKVRVCEECLKDALSALNP